MRRLILMRHGKSDWSTAGQPDIDRPLSARGRFAVPLMGAYMERQGLRPERAIVSTALRTRETWALLRPAFSAEPDVHEEPRLYDATLSTLLDVIGQTSPDIGRLLLVGHNPGMEELATCLAGSGSGLGKLEEKFPTAALAVIDIAADTWGDLTPGSGTLERFIVPDDLSQNPAP